MTPEKLFHELLGLGLNWEVVRCEYDRAQSKVTLEIRETTHLWQFERCPHDGAHVACYDHTEPLRWRHRNFFDHECEIACRLPRGRCPQCERVYRVTPPWEGLSKHFTKGFEAFALLLMREMPAVKAAVVVEETDTRLWRMLLAHVAKAYQMRLTLQDIYELESASRATKRLGAWCRWVRREAKKHAELLLLPMVKVAEMVTRHLVGIVAHWRHRTTNGWMEALNGVLQAIKRKARGYRTTEYLKAIIYFVAGKLRIPAT